MSSEARGFLPSAARVVLHGMSFGYGAVMSFRNTAYDFGLKKVITVDVPVIAIGNLTTGGTGKTPIVAAVVKMLQQAGHRPGIVSRGYRADASGQNDEKRVLEMQCPEVPHEQNADRIVASNQLIGDEQVTAIVLDDAFQHRRIHRNFNVVLIDATNPFGFGYPLPRGLLRESKEGLKRADFVLVTRSDSVPRSKLQHIRKVCVQHDPQLVGRIAEVCFQPTTMIRSTGERRAKQELAGQPVVVMTGIGNPEAFVMTCEGLNLKIVDKAFFPDHHHFTAAEVAEVCERANHLGAAVVTTVKDLVKIADPPEQLFAVDIQAVFSDADQQAAFEAGLRESLPSRQNLS
ncbi:MAG: tetraacyldisaccharide 4'-kinase [Fuerstiella sp.]